MMLSNLACQKNKTVLKVVSRGSRLALKQIDEINYALKFHHPEILFNVRCLSTKGDQDQKTSLMSLGPTNFFTDALDQALLEGRADIAIHSAKDLPDPLPKGLSILAITCCKNNQDTLVFRKGLDLKKLPQSLKVGVSSPRRQQAITQLFKKVHCVDVRGTIEKRLSYLEKNLDAVIIAKVALMRLGYHRLPQMDLEVQTPPLQGSLAIVARSDRLELQKLFECIDSRRNQKSLYFGLNAEHYLSAGPVEHLPLIKIKPIKLQAIDYAQLIKADELLFTSQIAPRLLSQLLENHLEIKKHVLKKKVICVGQQTRLEAVRAGFIVTHTALEESQEGLMMLFSKRNLKNTCIFYPKSLNARDKLLNYLKEKCPHFHACNLYQPIAQTGQPLEDLEHYQELVFTSSSNVKSFFDQYSIDPKLFNIKFKGRPSHRAFDEILSQRALK